MGFDAGGMRLEDALEWATHYGFHHIDFNADRQPNHLNTWDAARVRAIRQHCERADIHLGLHTLSAVNVAEFSPYVSEAVDAYLRANIDVAHRLGCAWLVVHAGFHLAGRLPSIMHIWYLQRSTVFWMPLASRVSVRCAWPTTWATERYISIRARGTLTLLFQRLEVSGYQHHYMMAFGSREDKLAGRDYFTACWPER
jgi:hypothetical protein